MYQISYANFVANISEGLDRVAVFLTQMQSGWELIPVK